MKKILAVAVSVVFVCTNVSFAHRPSVNIWEERQHSQPYPLAILPTLPVSFRAQARKFASPLVDNLPPALFAHLNIKDVHSLSGAPAVLLIEDLHQNLEAQTHISEAIRSFGDLAGPGETPVF